MCPSHSLSLSSFSPLQPQRWPPTFTRLLSIKLSTCWGTENRGRGEKHWNCAVEDLPSLSLKSKRCQLLAEGHQGEHGGGGGGGVVDGPPTCFSKKKRGGEQLPRQTRNRKKEFLCPKPWRENKSAAIIGSLIPHSGLHGCCCYLLCWRRMHQKGSVQNKEAACVLLQWLLQLGL